MNETNHKPFQTDEIDLLDLAKKLLRRWYLILAMMILGGAAAGVYTTYRITPLYQSQCMLYVNNGALSVGSTTVSLQDLNASKSLVDTYLVILKSRKVLMEVADKAGLPYGYDTMNSMISGSQVNGTEVFSVTVTSPNPEEAELVANVVADVLPVAIADIVEGSTAKIVDYAVVPYYPISPSKSKNILMGAMLGAMLCCGILVLMYLLDDKIENEEDMMVGNKYPLLSVIPELKKPKGSGNQEEENVEDLSFASQEAYHLLGTNVMYSLADQEQGKVIGIASSVAAEYKSTTAINLAKTLARNGQKVLLLDCDLRLSYLDKRLGVEEKPGLTEYLTGTANLAEILRNSKQENLDVIVSGTRSMNPGELLRSHRMERALTQFRKEYDYIVIDFPPINIVVDSLVLGKLTDGFVMVAREGYTQKKTFLEALNKLKFLDIRVLGLVLTGRTMSKKDKSYRGYHSYYGKRSYYGKEK